MSTLLIISLGNSRKYPYPTMGGFHVSTPPCFQKFQNALPPMPSEFHNREPPLPFRIYIFLEVHFGLTRAYINKRTRIDASSRLWSSGARWQALLFSNKKNLPLVARLCKLLSKSEFGYKNEHHLHLFYSSLFSCVVLTFTKQNSSNSDY